MKKNYATIALVAIALVVAIATVTFAASQSRGPGLAEDRQAIGPYFLPDGQRLAIGPYFLPDGQVLPYGNASRLA